MAIRTSIQSGARLLQDTKNMALINFAIKSAAERNAEKYSKKFLQNITVVNIPAKNGQDIFYLMAEKAIL